MESDIKRRNTFEISCNCRFTTNGNLKDSYHANCFQSADRAKTKSPRHQLASQRFTRTLIIISSVLAVYLTTWSPYFLLKIMFFIDQTHPITKNLVFHQIAFVASILPPVLNPLLYICQFPAIKRHFCKIKKTVNRKSEVISSISRKFTVAV